MARRGACQDLGPLTPRPPRADTQVGGPWPQQKESGEGSCLWDWGTLQASLWGKEESWPCCQQNLGSLPALRNIHTFMYLPHGFAVRQHMCCGCTMQSEKSTRQEKCCCGEVAQAMVPGVRVAARDAPLLPARGEVCTQLPFCKGKSLITRCLGSSGLHFLTLISLLLACGLVLFFAERKY